MLDIVSYLLKVYDDNQMTNPEDSDKFSILQYKDVQFLLQQVGEIIDFSENNPVCHVHADSPLFECIGLFQKGVHRVAVISNAGITENILTQSDVVRFLISNLDNHLDIFEKSVREIFGIGNKPIISVKENEIAANAFKLIQRHKISAVAVLDDDGKIIGNLSASDLKGVVKSEDREGGGGSDPVGSLFLPVLTFLQQGGMSKFPVATCQLSASLSFVLLKIMALHVHRLWVVDENDIAIGVISLTDVMQAVISQKQEDRKI